ncbi:MAG: hypothetical protein ACM3L8_06460, partial [Verrucomicrobiota bacterium]
TDVHKVPETILSRCQRFDFRMLTDAEVRGRLDQMARAEGVTVDEDALALMARYAFGSMRDGQSLLEQAAVSGSGSVTAALVEGMLGLVGTEAAIDLAAAAVLDGAGPALNRFAALHGRGADLKYLYLSLIDVLRDVTVLAFTERAELLSRYSPTSLERVREFASRRAREEWMLLLDIAFRSERDVLGSEFPHLGFELLLLRLANAQSLLPLDALEAGGAAPVPAPERPAPAPAATFSRKGAPAAASAPAEAAKPVERGGAAAAPGLWDALKRTVEGKRKAVLTSLLSQMEGTVRDGELVISCGHEMLLERLKESDKWPLLVSALEEAAGRPFPLRLEVSAEKKSPEPDAVAAPDDALERKALSDPLVLEVLQAFEGATLLKVERHPPAAPAPSPAVAAEAAEGEDVEEPPPGDAPAGEEEE